MTEKTAVFSKNESIWPHSAGVELSQIAPILEQRNCNRSQVAVFCDFVTGRLRMLGPIARWGHNVLIATMGLLTIAMVVSLIQ